MHLEEVDPIYFNKPYYVVPSGAEKAFAVLVSAMDKEEKAAVAKTVFGTKETHILIRAKDGQTLLNTLFLDQGVTVNPAKQIAEKGTAAEMKMATAIIDSMTGEFVPSEYKDEYREKVMNAIEKKIAGKEIVSPKEKTGATITDLMEALTKSLEMTKTKAASKTAALACSRNKTQYGA